MQLKKNLASYAKQILLGFVFIQIGSFLILISIVDMNLKNNLLLLTTLIFGVPTIFLINSLLNSNHLLQGKLNGIESEKEILNQKVNVSQNLIKMNEDSQEMRTSLLTNLHHHYRYMAAQAHAINLMTSKFAMYDKQISSKENLSEDSNTVLKPLLKGFPMSVVSEPIEVMQCLENVTVIFRPQLLEMNVNFSIKGRTKMTVTLDKTIFELVLHNIFSLIMKRFLNNRIFTIELKETEFLELCFSDNGDDVTCGLENTRRKSLENILCLEMEKLEDLINWLGWAINFQKIEGVINIIKLSIPINNDDGIDCNYNQENVVRLFE